MKLAIISDIHGNYDAFQAVLADIDRQNVDQIACLGDSIGYGPEPERVVDEINKRAIPSIMGNHELAVCNQIHLDWFNPLARISLEKTLKMLSRESLRFLCQLPYSRVTAGCRCVHGYPPDSARTYLFQKSIQELHKTLKSTAERITFVGHTHDLEIISYNGRDVARAPLSSGITDLSAQCSYIINIGSIGQPRDGDNQAKYVIWDQAEDRLDVRFIPYDIAIVVAKIKAAGLPEAHARRLW